VAINVLLLDDHAVVRDGLRALLDAAGDIAVVASCGAAEEALRLAERDRPDVAILDVSLPGMDGIETARRLHDLSPETHALMLSMHASPEYVYQAFRAGATGYVLKESAGDEVVEAVRAVHAGRRFLSGKISSESVADYASTRNADHPLERLSARELQVLKRIVEGATSNAVAAELGISPKSVDTYRSRLMVKLGADDLTKLVKFAIRHGITSL
jgi:DNA-binding NarL/FixJ family response regulator